MDDGAHPAAPRSADRETIVASGYDRAAERYATLEAGEAPWPRKRWLSRLLDQLSEGSRVLDLGCGSGIPATREISRRHSVLGVDISPRQIELARRNVPHAEFRQADVLDLRFASQSFDAVVALYLLDHIPRERLVDLLGGIADWLKPGGLLLACSEPQDREGVVAEWLGVPMYFSSVEAETAQRLVQAAGFSIVDAAVEPQLEGDREVDYLWLLARKDEQPLRR